MSKPSSREELKQYALRKLGAPVIEVNVDDAQLEDSLDDGVYDVEFTCYLNTTGPSQPNFVGFYPVVALLTDKQPKLQEVEVIVKATV